MRFKDIAFRNFKAQIRKYTAYLLCSSFAIMMFFIYSTILFNKSISNNNNDNPTNILFGISLMAIALFSVIFINYAHTAFIKSRYKEFGLYLTLGMTKKDVRKIIILENTIIILFSSMAGILAGLIFSRLFQMIVSKVLDLKNVLYHVDYKSFILTLGVFLSIFAIVIVLSILSTRKLEISELLKESRKNGKNKHQSIIPGLAGIILIAAALIMVSVIAKDKTLNTNMFLVCLFALTGFAGIYFFISALGNLIIGILKKKRNAYYNNMIVVTEIKQKFKQSKKVLFILSILSSMIVFFMASPISLLSLSKTIAETNVDDHLQYVELPGINNLPHDRLEKILNSGKTALTRETDIEFMQLSFKSTDKYDTLQKKPVISVNTYNRYFKTKISVPRGKAINVINAWEPGYHGISPSSRIDLKDGSNTFRFTVNKSVHYDVFKWIYGSSLYPASSSIILNDLDYKEVKSRISPENIGIIHSARFKDWLLTEDIVQKLQKSLDTANTPNAGKNTFKVASTYGSYQDIRQGYSLFVFIMSFLGILFFISAGSVLYFKQYTEIGADREKFRKLFKIGILEREVRKVVSRELALTFFSPLVLGSVMGYAFMYLVTYMVGGQSVLGGFMINATKVVGLYFVFQTTFYLITKRKYVKELI